MTQKQAEQFNRMLAALKQISKGYQTPDQLRRSAEKEYSVGYEEAIEMAYENIKELAKLASRGVRRMAT